MLWLLIVFPALVMVCVIGVMVATEAAMRKTRRR